MDIILASQSPRRQQLLRLIGLEFQVVPADVDETPFQTESPPDYVARLAAMKARWVSDRLNGDHIIVAADTTVVDGTEILGKPDSHVDADIMLRQLRGRTHQVYTGIAIAKNDDLSADVCSTDVPMRQYSNLEIQTYIDSGDPLDKAGGYAIQHAGFNPVENLQGCFANVMGLPLCHLTRVLRKLGIDPYKNVPESCQETLGYKCPVYRIILREEI